MQLVVQPQRSLIDATPSILVRDLPPRSLVSLTVAAVDDAGHVWRSSGEYRSGADGTLQLEDPDRPWWDMAYCATSSAPVAFAAPDGELTYELIAEHAEGTARTTAVRSWGHDVGVEALAGDGWALRAYRPHSGAARPPVLVVPGAAGAIAAAPTAALLASHGHLAAVLDYGAEPTGSSAFRRIAVEAVCAGMRAFHDLSGAPAIAVMADSLGTAPALRAMAEVASPPISAVVAISPTHVVWQALGPGGKRSTASSLTLAGAELPYLGIHWDRLLYQRARTRLDQLSTRRHLSSALRLHPAYAAGLKATPGIASARIPVERIDAPMLIIAGEQDDVWPSAFMAREIADRRSRPEDRLILLPGVGHFLRAPTTPTTVTRTSALISGGNPEDGALGQRLAWDAILSRLS